MSKKNEKFIQDESNEDSLEIDLLKSMLKATMEDNKRLRNINQDLEEEKLSYRDMVALNIFTQLYSLNPDTEQAAEDSFKYADVFMRVKERGRGYKIEIIQQITDMGKENPNDSDFGKEIRKFINKYSNL